MPYGDLPAFLLRLREQETSAACALQFLILTAARTGEALSARWSKIDTKVKIWSIPGERMKSGKKHRVPLTKDKKMAPEGGQG
jgi:integrase